ncbi:hypothetical protein CMV16_09740 [Peribacillus simplex]|nr:hypothetical protein CMV16_09740 [Peribacillus simplex]
MRDFILFAIVATFLEKDNIARLSPLRHEHVNIVGRYSFILPEEIRDGRLRTFTYEEDNITE